MTRPRALVLTPRLPWPLDDGGRIGLWQAVVSTARGYETTLVSLVRSEDPVAPAPRELAELGVTVIRLAHRPPPTHLALLQGMVGRWPYTLARYRSRTLDARIRQLVAEQEFAFAYVNHLHLATYLDALEGVPVVLREHNLEHLLLDRYADSLTNPAARLYVKAQALRTRSTEANLCARCDLVLAIQDSEAAVLRRLAPATRVEVVPIGIDFAGYLPRAPESPPIVLLAGSWEWPPNADGARSFVERGWIRVRNRFPRARLRVAGKRMPRKLAEATRQAGGEPVGYVERMTTEFARAALIVVPLWVGAGSRVRIVEALAAQVPVVTTPLGAEGLGLEPGTHALFADTPESLGDEIAGLLSEPGRGLALAEAGHGLARARFSLEGVAAKTVELCGSVVRPSKNRPGTRGTRR